MNDKLLGYVIFICSLLGIACYFYLVFLSPWFLLTIQVSVFVAVAAIFAIITWLGYTLATTSPPLPLEDFDEEPSTEESEENAQI